MIRGSVLNRFLVHVLVSRLYPKQEHKQRGQTSITMQCASNMTQNMACYARCDKQCICVFRKDKDEQGIILANQVCHWIGEVISVEIDIKITGIGCTVSAFNSMMPLSMEQEVKLLHPNISEKHIAVIYS